MKFWQLCSICSDQPGLLDKVFSRKQWHEFGALQKALPELVRIQDREKLDAVVPNELSVEVLAQHPGHVFRSNGALRTYRLESKDKPISYLDAFQEFGGSFLEEVLEKGSKKI